MKKVFSILVFSILLIISGCSAKQKEYSKYAVVHYEKDYYGKDTGRIILGERYSASGKKSTVYYYNRDIDSIQLQPTKYGSMISNVDAPWEKIESIEKISLDNVYYNERNDEDNFELKLVNKDEINIYKIIVHQKMLSIINIREIYVIDIKDILEFEFLYKIEEVS